ncbi:MAG: agmatine deiminase family protein [Planctomycetota bacterium]
MLPDDSSGSILPRQPVRVPADWEPVRRVWLAWPHNTETWPGRFGPIPSSFRNLARVIAESSPVAMIGEPDREKIAGLAHPQIEWHPIATDDCWIRDYGPTFVLAADGSREHAVDWRFNAWGGKYAFERDDAAAAAIINQAGWTPLSSNLCLEGGALEHDGRGTLLTTSACLNTPSRNPGWKLKDIEAELRRCLGSREIIWIDGDGLAGDDTDGHIDQLVRFVHPECLVVASCDELDVENYTSLRATASSVEQWAARQAGVRVVELPIPQPRYIQGRRVPESYCNFLRLGPDRLLVPAFGDRKRDDNAREQLEDLAREKEPHLRAESVDCRDLVWGLGALHCATCTEPDTRHQ